MTRLSSFLLFVFLLMALPAGSSQAQGLRMGLRGGVNFSTLQGDTNRLFGTIDAGATGFRTSYHFGALVAVPVSDRYALQTELLYIQKGSTFQGDFFAEDNVEGTYRFSYLHLPVLFRIRFPLDAPGTPILYGGPALDVNTAAGIQTEYRGQRTIRNVEAATRMVGLGGVVGGGFSYPLGGGRRLLFDLRYNPVFTDLVKESFTIRSTTIIVSLGFTFSL